MQREAIHTHEAPAAVGTYSQAIRAGGLLFLSGQVGLVPETLQLDNASIEDEIHRMFRNLQAVARQAGASLNQAVKVNVYLTDLAHYASLNQIMQQYFDEPYPARAAIGVVSLPRGARVEADAILVLDR